MLDSNDSSTTYPEYETFELLVGTANRDGYPLTIIESSAGEANGICLLDPANEELEDVLLAIEDDDVDAEFLKEVGAYLFEELFVDDISTLFRSSLSLVRGANRRLRVRLRIEPPELAALPWEYLYDAAEDAFLSTSSETALVRYIPMRLPARATVVSPPLRVLVVISNPKGAVPLDVEREEEIIQQALHERSEQGQIELRFLDHAMTAEINQAMREFSPHIFHFIGHGQFRGDEGCVVLENEDGSARLVGDKIFREFFQGTKDTRLVVLNACQTGTTSTTKPLAGLAPHILQRKLSAVVAMQYPMPDRAALIFSREFYRSLAQGYPVDAAVSEARKGIFMEIGAEMRDWGTPVLFLRAKDGQLFKVEEKTREEVTPPPEPTPPPEIRGFVGREAELAHLAKRLETSNLAIITGMPGIGKTALATALAKRVSAMQSVFWHSFNENESEGIEEVIWKLAGFLYWNGAENLWRVLQGVQKPPTELLLEYLVQEMRAKNYLLCLDDLQFLDVDEADMLGAFIQQFDDAETVFVLVSQTAPQFVNLSDVTPLGGLSLADTRRLLDERDLTLFTEQQQELHERTGGNAQFLVLAINALKSARNPKRLMARLTETSDIERYLMTAVDKELTDTEREVMSGLSVLQCCSTRGAIEAVLERGGLRRVLIDLSNRSLLTTHDGEWGKEYGQNTLIQSFYYSLLSHNERQTRHRRAGIYYETEELDMLRAARHFLHAEEYNKAADLIAGNARKLTREGRTRQLAVLLRQFTRDQVDLKQWVNINLALGEVYIPRGEGQKARECYQNALSDLALLPGSREMRAKVDITSVFDKLGESEKKTDMTAIWDKLDGEDRADTPEVRRLRIRAYKGLGRVNFQKSLYNEALSYFQQALSLLEMTDERWEIADCLVNVGMVYWRQGDNAAALRSFEKARSIFRKLDDQRMIAICLNNIGLVHRYQGFYAAASQDYEKSLESQRKMGDKYGIATALINLGEIRYQQGAYLEARSSLQEALTISQEMGDRFREAISFTNLGDVCHALEEYETAIQHYGAALAICERIGDREGVAWGLLGMVATHLAQSEVAVALEHAERALKIAQEINSNELRGKALRSLGEIYSSTPQSTITKAPAEYFEESIRVLQELGEEGEIARSLARYGEYQIKSGDRAEGEELLQQARDTFEWLGMAGELAKLGKVDSKR